MSEFDIKSNRIRRQINNMAIMLAMLFSFPLQAHYLWFDPLVVSASKTNSNQIYFKIYFGEFQENLYESIGTRLLERKETDAQFGFDDKFKNVELKTKNNYFLGSIKPTKNGLIDLIAQDIKSPVVDYRKFGIGVVKPMFYTRTRFLLFKDKEISHRIKEPKPIMTLDIIPKTLHLNPRSGEFGPKVGDEVLFQVFFNKIGVNHKLDTLKVYAPNGWVWKPRLDKNGIGHFNPLWKGTYVVEVIHIEKKLGKFDNISYEALRHRATLSILVK